MSLGLIYKPGMPLLFQSYSNAYIIRRSDGFSIDGKYFGLSKFMFRSTALKNNTSPDSFVDTTWLSSLYRMKKTKTPFDHLSNRSPLNLGQMINCGPEEASQNVTYYEYTLPGDFPSHLRTYFPNIYYNEDTETYPDQDFPSGLKTILLISTRDLSDEELLSDYNFIAVPPPQIKPS